MLVGQNRSAAQGSCRRRRIKLWGLILMREDLAQM